MAKGFGIGDLTSLGFGQLGFGQMGQLFDNLDLMRKTWSSATLPSAMTPTLSLEELDKRIGDLRAVEQWLTLNQNMLRGTIQGLEVQRATIATLRSFGQALGAQGAGDAAVDPGQLASVLASLQQQAAARPAQGAGAESSPAQSSSTPSSAFPSAPFPSASLASSAGAASAASSPAPGSSPADGAPQGDAAQLAQAWWTMLNDQFQQVAGAALGGLGARRDAADGPGPDAAGGSKNGTPAAAGAPSGPKRARGAAAKRPANGERAGSAKRSPRRAD